MDKMKAGLVAAAVLLLVFSVWQYGNAREAQALAESRADSLNNAQQMYLQTLEERNALRIAFDSATSQWIVERDSLDQMYANAEAAADEAESDLERLLAATGPQIPDSVLNAIRNTVAALNTEIDACQLQLESCDNLRAAVEEELVRERAAHDSTQTESTRLLTEYEQQLEDAIDRAGGGTSILGWVERGFALYGVVSLVIAILGGGGG